MEPTFALKFTSRLATVWLTMLVLGLTASAMAAEANLGLGISAGLGTNTVDEPSTADKTAAPADSSKPMNHRVAKHMSKHDKYGSKPEQSRPEANQ